MPSPCRAKVPTAVAAVAAVVLIGVLSGPGPARASGVGVVTAIWTDFDDGTNGGLWVPTSASEPDTDHDLLAFTVDGTTWSTGVDDALLTARGVTFTAASWGALPVEGMGASSATNHFVARGDTEALGFAPPLTSADLSSLLTDGVRGLNLSSGVTNIPGGTVLTFNLPSVDAAAIGDGVPDVLVTQIANPASTKDTLQFVDADGATVGTALEIDQTAIDAIERAPATPARWQVRYWVVPDGSLATGFSFPTFNNLRLRAFDLAELGLTVANVGDVTGLLWTAGGSSDPAFFAYNTASMDVLEGSVTTATPTLTLDPIADRTLAEGAVTASATSSAGLPVTFGTTTAGICAVDPVSGQVDPAAVGSCEVTAATARTRVGTVRYDAVTTSTTFAVLDGSEAEPEPEPEPEPDRGPTPVVDSVEGSGPDTAAGVDPRPAGVPTGGGAAGAPVRLALQPLVAVLALMWFEADRRRRWPSPWAASMPLAARAYATHLLAATRAPVDAGVNRRR